MGNHCLYCMSGQSLSNRFCEARYHASKLLYPHSRQRIFTKAPDRYIPGNILPVGDHAIPDKSWSRADIPSGSNCPCRTRLNLVSHQVASCHRCIRCPSRMSSGTALYPLCMGEFTVTLGLLSFPSTAFAVIWSRK